MFYNCSNYTWKIVFIGNSFSRVLNGAKMIKIRRIFVLMSRL